MSEARLATLHFLVLLLIICWEMFNWSREIGGLSAPDLAILRHALLRDKSFSLGVLDG